MQMFSIGSLVMMATPARPLSAASVWAIFHSSPRWLRTISSGARTSCIVTMCGFRDSRQPALPSPKEALIPFTFTFTTISTQTMLPDPVFASWVWALLDRLLERLLPILTRLLAQLPSIVAHLLALLVALLPWLLAPHAFNGLTPDLTPEWFLPQ